MRSTFYPKNLTMRIQSPRPLVAVVLLASAAACSDPTGIRNTRGVSLSFTSRATSPRSAPYLGATLRPAGDLLVAASSAGGQLRVNSVQLVLAHVELSQAASCTPGNNDNQCDELEAAPILVDLPLDTTVKKAVDAQIPPGTYSRLQAELAALDGKGDASAFIAAHPDFRGISVRVSGIYTDASGVDHPFTYTSAVDAEIEIDFPKPITIGATTSNLTVSVDAASWFRAQDGSLIDPTVAGNASAIDSNIRRSFNAFEDDNRDGSDDH